MSGPLVKARAGHPTVTGAATRRSEVRPLERQHLAEPHRRVGEDAQHPFVVVPPGSSAFRVVTVTAPHHGADRRSYV
jgi:hypothetical protein